MKPAMRLRSILLLLFPALLFGAPPREVVQVTARVPLIVAVEGPERVVLTPGEVVRIRVGVAANVPWVLDVHSPNTWATVSAPVRGWPGAAVANQQELEISCSAQARGPQAVALVYTLMPR